MAGGAIVDGADCKRESETNDGGGAISSRSLCHVVPLRLSASHEISSIATAARSDMLRLHLSWGRTATGGE